MTTAGKQGVPAIDLTDEDLVAELASLHRKRHEALRFAGDSPLSTHLRRTAELEQEYLRRRPGREVGQGPWSDAAG
jgi:hypothetical protein